MDNYINLFDDPRFLTSLYNTSYYALGAVPLATFYLYQSAFQYFKLGYASAQAWLLFLIVIAFTVVLFRVSGRLVYYGGK